MNARGGIVGVIGGMGPEATIDLMRRVIDVTTRTEAQLDAYRAAAGDLRAQGDDSLTAADAAHAVR